MQSRRAESRMKPYDMSVLTARINDMTRSRRSAVPGLTADAGDRYPQRLDLPEAEVVLYSAFFCASEADRLLQELRDTTAWRQETLTLYGRRIDVPRLTAWYGDEGTRYRYSGITNVPLPWT